MKTLTKDGVSVYMFDDAEVVSIEANRTVIGNPETRIIGDCNTSNAVLHENVTPPEGWIGGKYLFDGTDFTFRPELNPTANSVKAEAQRRIYAILPDWKQRNLTARAAELAIKGQANWTTQEQAEYTAGQAVWDQIKAIRAASDALEAMDPIPANYTAEVYWT